MSTNFPTSKDLDVIFLSSPELDMFFQQCISTMQYTAWAENFELKLVYHKKD